MRLCLAFVLCLIVPGCKSEQNPFFDIEKLWFYSGEEIPYEIDSSPRLVRGDMDSRGNYYISFGGGLLSKLSFDGRLLWSHRFEEFLAGEGFTLSFGLSEEDGLVYVPFTYFGADLSEQEVFLLDMKTGEEQGRFKLGIRSGAVSISNGKVIVLGQHKESDSELHAYSLLGEHRWCAWSNEKAGNGESFMAVMESTDKIFVTQPLCPDIHVYDSDGGELFRFREGDCIASPKFVEDEYKPGQNVRTGKLVWEEPPFVSQLHIVDRRFLVIVQAKEVEVKTLSLWTLGGKELVSAVEIPDTPIFAYGDALYFLKDEEQGGKKGKALYAARLKKEKVKKWESEGLLLPL